MCGISGYRLDRLLDPAVLEAMTEALHHRGPDEAGYFRSAPFHAGMRRLSINDVAQGHQPLFNEDRSVVVLYNGEIYNFPELRRELEQRGHRFRTHSDGEVICHLWEECGEDLFERLDGMFAVSLWVPAQRKLILARDLPGEKPLHYLKLSATELAFSSEIKGLLPFPGFDKSLNLQALWDFPSFLWIPEPETVYRDIRALPRGHLLIADDDGIRVRAYANRFNTQPLADISDEGVVAETRRIVTEAVESRLLSDVPVGSFLSSGLDSSIVATIAARRLDRLDTFSVGFENLSDPYHGHADESAAAAAYARQLGTNHHEIRVTAATFCADLENFCRYGDQPFAVSSGLGILAVARAAREAGIKVLLSGDGADELFGGYSWYAPMAGLSPAKAGPRANNPVSFQNFGLPMADRLAVLAAMPPAERAWAWHYYAAESEKASLFHADRFAGLASSLRWFDGLDDDPLSFIAHDRRFYLPFEMMRKVDRMTMAVSVEGRAPFVAPAVLNHAEKLQMGQMVRGDVLKWALRQAFADLLPEDVALRPKHGFNVPIDHWLRGEWNDLMRHTFAPGSALNRLGMLAPDAEKKAESLLADPVRLNGHTVFCYVMLNLWLEQH